ncbi:bifunctional metallophosphatase/5'-nucleotidase [Methanoculleus chikugoensis]|uniref:Multifunctional 2',3'-cyclic-nucleotide 2'-phosphodiesterase/5'-nucleotidase/3'-nucleotidase n=1 Tax=Methanoculleus chikugoensis TaxID=118126 RepID=A0ABN5XJH5_9EURY|nr:bifunctional metallophosphatase/5'-nucleotidase [Methanoculleus chikugoensis]BBL68128.1 multifunctional 2',3'-cyclic-nucleotide 2'-phosphodiesterase/5'-nucleotidase/3'-nucleotidase [Methanoculleus chikugoensis]
MTAGSPTGAGSPRRQAIIGLLVLLAVALAPIALSGYFSPDPEPVHVRILAVNDFHGQIPDGQKLNGEPAGSAPVLASYLRSAAADDGGTTTFIALPGDAVGASPPESGLLLDEPAVLFFNGLADDYPGMIATFGNHEFDRGTDELLRMVRGGNGTAPLARPVDPYPGAAAEYVSSNVVWKTNGTLLAAPYTIRDAGGAKIAFIGATTVETPSIQKAINIEEVLFEDETESINRYVPEIQQQGVHAIVVVLHEGGVQEPYDGPTREGENVTGRVAAIVAGLDADVDVVLSGHTHAFTNAYLENAGQNPVLVTQAYSYGRAFADVDIVIDPLTGEVTHTSARIVPAYRNGTSPDPEALALLEACEAAVEPLTARVITTTSTEITRLQTDAGESALGNLVADSQRAAMGADIAFVTTGSLRAEIAKGNVTRGDLYAVQPFSSTVLSMTLTGEQVRNVLERQWEAPLPPHNLAVSGLTYTFDERKPAGDRIVDIRVNGTLLDPNGSYTAAMVDFLATGGDKYAVFREGTNIVNGPYDVDALVAYMESLPEPVDAKPEGRIAKAGQGVI